MKQIIKILLILFCFIIVLPMGYTADITNAYSYWSFDDNVDDEIGDNDGTLIADDGLLPEHVGDCMINNCFFFSGSDGDGYIDMDNQMPNSDFTISIWVNWDGSERDAILNTWDAAGNTLKIDIDQGNDNKMDYQVGTGASYCTLDGILTTLIDSNWHMITLVMDDVNNILSAYHDNATLDNSIACTVTNFDNAFNQFSPLGASYQAPTIDTNRWAGYIDEFLVDNEAWSIANIQEVYTYGINGIQFPFANDTTPPYINITYPINNTYYNNYNGSILININESGNCILNNSDWDANGNETHFNFINNTHILNGDYEIFIECNDLRNNKANKTLFFTVEIIEDEEITGISLNITELTESLEASAIKKSSLWIGFIIFLLLLITAVVLKDTGILIMCGLVGIFYSIFLHNNYPEIRLIISMFFIFSALLTYIGTYWRVNK